MDRIKQSNICEEKENKAEEICEEIIAENFSKWKKKNHRFSQDKYE